MNTQRNRHSAWTLFTTALMLLASCKPAEGPPGERERVASGGPSNAELRAAIDEGIRAIGLIEWTDHEGNRYRMGTTHDKSRWKLDVRVHEVRGPKDPPLQIDIFDTAQQEFSGQIFNPTEEAADSNVYSVLATFSYESTVLGDDVEDVYKRGTLGGVFMVFPIRDGWGAMNMTPIMAPKDTEL